jgi:hypothetical protein
MNALRRDCPLHLEGRITAMSWNRMFVMVGLMIPSGVMAQESYKVEALKEAPPASVAAAVKGVLETQGYRVLDDQGKPFADIWLRKGIPASGKPAGPNGNIQFPVLKEGELLGVLRYAVEGHDYRDQSIPKGVYTLRYGLQPVNGDHLGVSPFRDYALLIPAAKDTSLAVLAQKKLQEESAESAGASHPAVLMLLAVPESEAKGAPTMVHDEAKNTWGAVVPLRLDAKGAVTLPVQLVLVGAAAT